MSEKDSNIENSQLHCCITYLLPYLMIYIAFTDYKYAALLGIE